MEDGSREIKMEDGLREKLITRARVILNHPGFASKTLEDKQQVIRAMLDKGLRLQDLRMLKQEMDQNKQATDQNDQPGSVFSRLDKNILVQILNNLTPREIINQCSLNKHFADVCRIPDVFKFFMHRDYPAAFLTNNPRAQYVALTYGIETTYRMSSLTNIEDQDSQEKLFHYTNPVPIGPPLRPESTPGWSVFNEHGSILFPLMGDPVFAGWLSKTPEACFKMEDAKRILFSTGMVYKVRDQYDQFIDDTFLAFMVDYRKLGPDALYGDPIVQSFIEQHRMRVVRGRDSDGADTDLPQVYNKEKFLQTIEKILSDGKSEGYKDGLGFDKNKRVSTFTASIKGNPLPKGTTAWAIIREYASWNQLRVFKSREDMASHFAEFYYKDTTKQIENEFSRMIFRPDGYEHLRDLRRGQWPETKEYQDYVKSINLWPLTPDTLRQYAMDNDSIKVPEQADAIVFKLLTFG